MAETIADRMRIARLDAKLTYESAAALMEMPPSTIERIENGKTKKPRRATLALAAEAYGVSLDWLLFGANAERINSQKDQPRVFLAKNHDEILLLSTFRTLSPLLRRVILGSALIGSGQPFDILEKIENEDNEGNEVGPGLQNQ